MPRYGCHDLQLGDSDGVPIGAALPRWGGVDNAPADQCPIDLGEMLQLLVAPNTDNQINVSEHVRTLQEDLRTLGFTIVGTPNGEFGRRTAWAVREFQIYAKMEHVARVRADAEAAHRQGAHVVTARGANATNTESIYVASLEQVENDQRYTGPVSGVVNADTRAALEHWLENDWRCPVVIEAWTMSRGNRVALVRSNLWRHDDLANVNPRMFARDFSRYYDSPDTRNADDYFVIGDFARHLGWSGPRSVAPSHTWTPEAEVLPAAFIDGALSAAQTSTFKVVRAVAEVECEGHFDSVNSYDNAFVSAGPCHWTLGIVDGNTVSEGELCGFLAYLRAVDEGAFEAAMGFFGARVDEAWGTDGGDLFIATSRKYVGWMALQREDREFERMPLTEADGDYFKTWHWFYRFVMAGRTIDGYRERMWHMARVRIRDIRATPWGAHTGAHAVNIANVGTSPGRAATIGDVFTSERATAILLRWHVRYPSGVVNGGAAGADLRRAVRIAIGRGTRLDWTGDPSNWTDAHEQQLVEGLRQRVAQRNNANFSTTINQVDGWPNWVDGTNPNGFTLTAPRDRLSEARNSFIFDDEGLPAAPT